MITKVLICILYLIQTFTTNLADENETLMNFENQIFHPNRIVGGVDTRKAEFPFQLDVRMKSLLASSSSHACGGAIVNERWIVTAAHCSQRSVGNYVLVAGAHDFSKPSGDEQTRLVEKIVVHPQYDSSTVRNDIALMKVVTPFVFNKAVGAVKLAPAKTVPPSTVIGWGTLQSGGSSPDILQKVNVPFVSDAHCKAAYRSINDIVPSMVCYGEKGKDSCQGDSGGPLLGYVDSVLYQIGIVSWGYGCAEAQYPGVYTEVADFDEWVKSVTASN